MTHQFRVVDPAEVDGRLRGDLLETWVAVTDAGGSVGFTAPAPVDAVAEALDRALTRVRTGTDRLGVLHAGGRAIGMGMLVSRGSALTAHWRTVLRVMVHPRHQGEGAGDVLMRGLHAAADDLGLQHLLLTVRGGENLEGFYRRHGYQVVGRHPAAIRVADGDYRDEIAMVAPVAVSSAANLVR